MRLGYQVITTSIGEILVAGTAYAITQVLHGTNRTALASDFMMRNDDVSSMHDTGYIKEVCIAMQEYMEGRAQRIDAAVQLEGTEFQRKVWNAIREIPYGTTASYTDIAERIGAPDAFRAVANACGDNPVPLIIPCHRVVQKNGDMGGFAWGEEAKRFLLDLEHSHVPAEAAH